jgi:hypothetical protein
MLRKEFDPALYIARSRRMCVSCLEFFHFGSRHNNL